MPWGSWGGVPCQVQLGGGGTQAGGVPWLGGYPGWGGTLARWGTLAGGGTQLGQHSEYFLHGGRYASCVHAGGLSCIQNKISLLTARHWLQFFCSCFRNLFLEFAVEFFLMRQTRPWNVAHDGPSDGMALQPCYEE